MTTETQALSYFFTPEETEKFLSKDWGTAQDAVNRGVAYLDRVIPDWRDRVEINTLKLSSTCDCVLGQLFQTDAQVPRELKADEQEIVDESAFDDGFTPGIIILDLHKEYYEIEDAPAIFLGFDLKTDDTIVPGLWDYNELTDLWRAALSA